MSNLLKIAIGLSIIYFGESCQNKNAVNTTENKTEVSGNKISDMINNPATANSEEVNPKDAAVIEFDKKEFYFEKVKAGAIVTHEFKFKNVGKNPLVIKDAQASCGCTVAEFPREPIPIGGTGSIKASFNTEGRNSLQAKYISVYANTIPSLTKLLMEGEVSEK